RYRRAAGAECGRGSTKINSAFGPSFYLKHGNISQACIYKRKHACPALPVSLCAASPEASQLMAMIKSSALISLLFLLGPISSVSSGGRTPLQMRCEETLVHKVLVVSSARSDYSVDNTVSSGLGCDEI